MPEEFYRIPLALLRADAPIDSMVYACIAASNEELAITDIAEALGISRPTIYASLERLSEHNRMSLKPILQAERLELNIMPYLCLDTALAACPHLNPLDKIVHATLCYVQVDGKCFPSQSTLAEMVGLEKSEASLRRIRRALTHLKERGMIKASRRGFNESNQYSICQPIRCISDYACCPDCPVQAEE